MEKALKSRVLAFFAAWMAIFYGCKQDPEIPTLTTSTVNVVTATVATAGGIVTSDGGAQVTEKGVCWDTSENPTTTDNKTSDGYGTGSFYSNLIQLNPNTKYYVRAYATNKAGTGYGNQVIFTTKQIGVATLTTAAVTEITEAGAITGGNIVNNVEGTITTWGVCWGTSANPTVDNSKTTDTELEANGSYISYIYGLQPSMKYYVRAYATNSAGTAYGNELSFITLANVATVFNPGSTYSSVSDIDGNVYKITQIGTQFWMAENLKTTKFNDWTLIPNVRDDSKWESLTTPGYCWYNNDEATYKGTYGALYNWYAVKTDKLCPMGWHVPSNDEWNTLITYLGGENAAGAKVIETGKIHWLETLIAGATNETGFTGLPGGSRSGFKDFKGFVSLGIYGHWWTTTEYTPPNDALVTQLPSYDYDGHWGFEAGFAAKKVGGMSVRCLKN